MNLKQKEVLKNRFIFADRLTTEISSRNLPFVKKQNDCWQFQHLLNQLQGTLDHIEVKDTWFDKLELYVENKRKVLVAVTPKIHPTN